MDDQLKYIVDLSAFAEILKEVKSVDPKYGKEIENTLIENTKNPHKQVKSSGADTLRLKCALYQAWISVDKTTKHYESIVENIEIMAGQLWKHALYCTDDFFNRIESGVDEFLASKQQEILKELKGKHEWYSGFSDGAKTVWSHMFGSDEVKQKATLVGDVMSSYLSPDVLKENLERIFLEAEQQFKEEWNKQIKLLTPSTQAIQTSDMDVLLANSGDYKPGVAEFTGAVGLASAAIGSVALAAGWHTLSYALINVFPPIAFFALTASAGLAFLNKDKSLLDMENKVQEAIKNIRRQIIIDLNFKSLPELKGKTIRRALLDESKNIVERTVCEWRQQVMGKLQPEHYRGLAASAKRHLLLIDKYLAPLDECTPEDHREFLAKKNFLIQCNKDIFETDEVEFLQEYGHWLEALQNGEIKPFTDEQRHFVYMCNGKTEPNTEKEKIWWRYIQRRKLEARGEYPKGL